ncbi:MAG: hypothetical protein JO073_15375 [Actinobacteria bacterium]|nr:hypothetical protein [Actinomycetota bacterium]
MNLGPARPDEFVALMEETYGRSMPVAEIEWWFANPAAPQFLNAARDDDGKALGILGMSLFRLRSGIASYALHAVTSPAARGRGVFSAINRLNEEQARAAGAIWTFGFPNPKSHRVLTQDHGWEDLPAPRVWVRPRRRPKRSGGFLVEPVCPSFERDAPFASEGMVRDAAFLNWRYAESPRAYHRVDGDRGWVVVTHAIWQGFSSAIVMDAAGEGLTPLLREAVGAVDSDIAIALVNPGEERAYLGAGFLPTPRTMKYIGKPLREDAPPIPRERRAWRVTFGDVDFF